MTWLLRLYPRAWRERYGAEIGEVVASQPASLQLAVDLLGGAIDAHVRPQAFARRLDAQRSEGGGTTDMVHRLRCGGDATANLTLGESLVAAALPIGAALAIAAVMMLTDSELTDAILLTMSPGIFVIGVQWRYLRGHSTLARLALILGPLAILFLIGLAAGLAVSD